MVSTFAVAAATTPTYDMNIEYCAFPRAFFNPISPRGGFPLFSQAFPVLSRILTENHLLNTSVGALVISAASVDEACVWCLLALVVSTVNAGSPLDAFYVFLLLIFFCAVMLTGEIRT